MLRLQIGGRLTVVDTGRSGSSTYVIANVGPVSNTVPLRPGQLQMNPPWGPTKATAHKLVDELAQLARRHIVFLNLATPGPDC